MAATEGYNQVALPGTNARCGGTVLPQILLAPYPGFVLGSVPWYIGTTYEE